MNVKRDDKVLNVVLNCIEAWKQDGHEEVLKKIKSKRENEESVILLKRRMMKSRHARDRKKTGETK